MLPVGGEWVWMLESRCLVLVCPDMPCGLGASCWGGRARSLNGSCLFGNVMWLSLEGWIERSIELRLAYKAWYRVVA